MCTKTYKICLMLKLETKIKFQNAVNFVLVKCGKKIYGAKFSETTSLATLLKFNILKKKNNLGLTSLITSTALRYYIEVVIN